MASPVTSEPGDRTPGISRAARVYAPQVSHAGVMGRTTYRVAHHLDGSQKQRLLAFGTL
jgi:hypothetical protein